MQPERVAAVGRLRVGHAGSYALGPGVAGAGVGCHLHLVVSVGGVVVCRREPTVRDDAVAPIPRHAGDRAVVGVDVAVDRHIPAGAVRGVLQIEHDGRRPAAWVAGVGHAGGHFLGPGLARAGVGRDMYRVAAVGGIAVGCGEPTVRDDAVAPIDDMRVISHVGADVAVDRYVPTGAIVGMNRSRVIASGLAPAGEGTESCALLQKRDPSRADRSARHIEPTGRETFAQPLRSSSTLELSAAAKNPCSGQSSLCQTMATTTPAGQLCAEGCDAEDTTLHGSDEVEQYAVHHTQVLFRSFHRLPLFRALTTLALGAKMAVLSQEIV